MVHFGDPKIRTVFPKSQHPNVPISEFLIEINIETDTVLFESHIPLYVCFLFLRNDSLRLLLRVLQTYPFFVPSLIACCCLSSKRQLHVKIRPLLKD